MATPPQLQSAVLHCDYQTRPAVPDGGPPAHELQSALRGTSSLQSMTEAPRCQQQHFYSVAAITTMSFIQLYKALPAGEEEGRKEINTPNQVFVLQPAVPPPLPYGHISTCSVRDPTSYITS